MENRGSTPTLTNLVGFTQGTSSKNVKQIRAAVQKKKQKSSRRQRRKRRRRRRRRRRIQGDRYSHTHSLNATKNEEKNYQLIFSHSFFGYETMNRCRKFKVILTNTSWELKYAISPHISM